MKVAAVCICMYVNVDERDCRLRQTRDRRGLGRVRAPHVGGRRPLVARAASRLKGSPSSIVVPRYLQLMTYEYEKCKVKHSRVMYT